MADNMNFEYLSLSKQDYVEKVSGEVTTSLISIMRVKYEFDPSTMEISEILLQEPSKVLEQ